MKLMFKQRFFSWFDSYDIFNENGDTLFTVEGQLSWGHRLHILNSAGRHVGTVKQKVLTFAPRFELYEEEQLLGELEKELFTFFKSRYHIDFNGWTVEGNFLEWEYAITDGGGCTVATVSKELFRLTDTYVIDVADPGDALYALMVVLAIDAEKCSRD